MFDHMIPEINDSINKTKKAIIALGCSFVQGHGAINESLFDKFKWRQDQDDPTRTIWELTDDDKKRMLDEYPDIKIIPHNTPDFSDHEVKNSFVNVLCTKYFNKEYTPINLGRSGAGNRSAIKDLYFYPDILWDKLEEIIVIYCPSGPERFDFMLDSPHRLNTHYRWVTMWPNSDNTDTPRNTLRKGYKDAVFSGRSQTLEQIAHMQELLTWCKLMKAKLIVVPSFQPYTRNVFKQQLGKNVIREVSTQEVISEHDENTYDDKKDIDRMIDMWPWSNMFKPEGHDTWVDICMSQEPTPKYFYEYVGTGSPNKWITPCAHPSAKGHDLFASLLYEHIKKEQL